MYSFGSKSAERLETIHPDLQIILVEGIKKINFTIIFGFRNQAEQDLAFRKKRSKVQWPNSKHNQSPSLAVDVAPWPLDWNDLSRFYYLAGIFMGIAHSKGIGLRFGGDWDMDGELTDNTFNDLGHFELTGSIK